MQCPFCENGELQDVREVKPWSPAHLQCNNCDSTYCYGDPNLPEETLES